MQTSAIVRITKVLCNYVSLKLLCKMLRVYTLFLILSNIICFGYLFSNNNGAHVKRGRVNDISIPPMKGVSFMNQNTSDLENVEGNMPESKSFVKDKVDSVQERRSVNKRSKRSVRSTNCSRKTSKHHGDANNKTSSTIPVYYRPSSHTSCQHFHIHLNGTKSEERTAWQFSCLSVFALIIVMILLLNCFHYYYGLSVQYHTKNDESDDALFGTSGNGTVNGSESELLLNSNNP